VRADIAFSDRYVDAERRAAAREVGVHAHRCQPPWEWRARKPSTTQALALKWRLGPSFPHGGRGKARQLGREIAVYSGNFGAA
jgi:hypothetical protein